MTFSQYFHYHSSLKPHWKQYYISYRELKRKIYHFRVLIRQQYVPAATAAAATVAPGDATHSNIVVSDQNLDDLQIRIESEIAEFCAQLDSDITDFVNFYERKVQDFAQELEYFSSMATLTGDMRKRMQDFYRNMEFLHSYANLNKQCIRELLRKFRKATVPFFAAKHLLQGTILHHHVHDDNDVLEVRIEEERVPLMNSPSSLTDRERTVLRRTKSEASLNRASLSSANPASSASASEGPTRTLHHAYTFREHHQNSILEPEVAPECLDAEVLRHEEELCIQSIVPECPPLGFVLRHIESLRVIQDREQTRLIRLMTRLELLYARAFTQNDLGRAIQDLRQPASRHKGFDIFRLGWCLGFMFPVGLLFLLAFVYPFPSDASRVKFYDSLPIFRAIFLYIEYIWLFAIDMWIWYRYRINYVYLLDLDPQKALNHVMLFAVASALSMVWITLYFIYLLALKGIAPTLVSPIWAPWTVVAITTVVVCFVLSPLHVFHLSARWELVKTFVRIFVSPLSDPRFREIFAADILTSMIVPLTDTAYLMCFYATDEWQEQAGFKRHDVLESKCHEANLYLGPALSFLPYWWRLMQCLRMYVHSGGAREHLYNALKYCCTILVIFFNAFHNVFESEDEWGIFRILWLLVIIVSTLYSFVWDVVMDWGLLKFRSEKHPFLRDRLAYRHRIVYFGAICFDLIARFSWTWMLSINFIPRFAVNKEFLKLLFGSVELARRCLWSIFRLEWLCLSNDEHYRKHTFVPPPVQPVPKYVYARERAAASATQQLQQQQHQRQMFQQSARA